MLERVAKRFPGLLRGDRATVHVIANSLHRRVLDRPGDHQLDQIERVVPPVRQAQRGSAGVNSRRQDSWRGVIGLQGDLEAAGSGSVLESWDWELSGMHSSSESISRVKDVLVDRLRTALRACDKMTTNQFGEVVPSTIKDRQEAGCFNPFYSSVVNSTAHDPLDLSESVAPSDGGFVISDTDGMPRAHWAVRSDSTTWRAGADTPTSPAARGTSAGFSARSTTTSWSRTAVANR